MTTSDTPSGAVQATTTESAPTAESASTAAAKAAVGEVRPRPRNLFAKNTQRLQAELKELLAMPSEEVQRQLMERYGEGLEIIESTDGRELCVVVKYPIPDSAVLRFKRYINSTENKVASATSMLLGDVIVYPPADVWARALKIEPALSDAFGQEVVRLSGAGATTEKKDE